MNETATQTESLLEMERKLAISKAAEMAKLLKERDDIEKAFEQRKEQIATELKALGYHRPRAPKGSKKGAVSAKAD